MFIFNANKRMHTYIRINLPAAFRIENQCGRRDSRWRERAVLQRIVSAARVHIHVRSLYWPRINTPVAFANRFAELARTGCPDAVRRLLLIVDPGRDSWNSPTARKRFFDFFFFSLHKTIHRQHVHITTRLITMKTHTTQQSVSNESSSVNTSERCLQ